MYRRPIGETVCLRLAEAPRHMQILAGPRQVGKTTLIRQVLDDRDSNSATYISADPASSSLEVGNRDYSTSDIAPSKASEISGAWLIDQWQRAVRANGDWTAHQDSRALQSSQPGF